MNFVRKNFRKINVAFFVLFLIVTIMLCILQQMADIHYRLLIANINLQITNSFQVNVKYKCDKQTTIFKITIIFSWNN